MTLIPTVINFYYTVVMAYGVFFLFSGFTTGPLPWTGKVSHIYGQFDHIDKSFQGFNSKQNFVMVLSDSASTWPAVVIVRALATATFKNDGLIYRNT